MDINKALEAEQGFLVENGPFYTGGATAPTGLDLPTKTLYLQETAGGILLWRKFNTGVNDWRQLSAQDIPFDNTGKKFVATDVDAALDEIRKRTTVSVMALISSLDGNYNVPINDSNIHYITGTATGYSVTLPDATSLFQGRGFRVVNDSSQTVFVKDNTGANIASLIAGDSASFDLEDNTLQAGNWLSVINTNAATGITSFTLTSAVQFNTTSTTDALITGFSVTPSTGRYALLFSSDLSIVANNALASSVAYVGGVAVESTRRNVQGVSSNFSAQTSSIGEINVNGAQAVDVRVSITANTLRVNDRSLILIRLGQAQI